MSRFYSPVPAMFSDMAHTLQTGLGSIGQAKVDSQRMMLEQALQENQMKRQAVQDARAEEQWQFQKPALEEQKNQILRERERGDTEVTFGMFFPTLNASNVGVGTDGDGPTTVQKIAETLGTVYDTDKDSPSFGRFIKQDGTRLKRREVEERMPEVMAVYNASIDPNKLMAGEMAEVDIAEQRGLIPPKEAQAKREKINAYFKSPEPQLKAVNSLLQSLEPWGGKYVDAGRARLEKQRDALMKNMQEMNMAGVTHQNRLAELEIGADKAVKLEGMQSANDIALEKMRQENKKATEKTPDFNESAAASYLNSARKDAIAAASDAMGNVDNNLYVQFMADTIEDGIRMKILPESARLPAAQKGGGDKPASQFASPDDVKAAVKSGKLSREEGLKTLRNDFGFK